MDKAHGRRKNRDKAHGRRKNRDKAHGVVCLEVELLAAVGR